jgi:hypothetical protein
MKKEKGRRKKEEARKWRLVGAICSRGNNLANSGLPAENYRSIILQVQ